MSDKQVDKIVSAIKSVMITLVITNLILYFLMLSSCARG